MVVWWIGYKCWGGTPLRLLMVGKSTRQRLAQKCAGLGLDFSQRKGHRAFWGIEVGLAGEVGKSRVGCANNHGTIPHQAIVSSHL